MTVNYVTNREVHRMRERAAEGASTSAIKREVGRGASTVLLHVPELRLGHGQQRNFAFARAVHRARRVERLFRQCNASLARGN